MAHTSDAHAPHGHSTVGHVVPVQLLAAVLLVLLVLTWLTYAVTKVNLGFLNIWIALGIAVLKASLVALYFMHLRWDRPFNGIVLISSLVFLSLFIGISLMDKRTYEPDITLRRQADVKEYAPLLPPQY